MRQVESIYLSIYLALSTRDIMDLRPEAGKMCPIGPWGGAATPQLVAQPGLSWAPSMRC